MQPRNRRVWATALLIGFLAACSTAISPSTPVTPTSPPPTPTTTESSRLAQPVVTVEAVTTVSLSSFIGWHQSPRSVGLRNGQHHTFTCPPGGHASAVGVWGTDIYTHDSSVCTAAVHAGLITFEDGGEVVIEMAPGQPSYLGTTANGVTTTSWGPWSRSFVFVDG